MGYVFAYLQGLSTDTPNETTLAAMREAEDFRAHPEKYKRYATFADAVADMY